MKHLASILILLTTLSTGWAQLSIGGGAAYSSEVEKWGVQVRGGYDVNEEWRGLGTFTYYFDGIEDFSIWEWNADANYFYYEDYNLSAYALGGINGVVSTLSDPNDSTEVMLELGLNIGTGGHYQLVENLKALLEIKYVISDFDQIVISGGVLFAL